MNTADFKSHALSPKEKIFGTGWLLFQTLCFAVILQTVNSLLPVPFPQSSVNFLFFCVNFTAVAVIFRRYLWAQIRLIPDGFFRILLTALPGFVAYWILSFLTTQMLLILDPTFHSINDGTVRSLVQENYILMFLGTVILVPITEECLFRGLVFRGLYDRHPVLGWIVSICAFSAVHILNYVGAYPWETVLLCFLQYIPAAVCLAGAYRLSGSLVAPILIHALVNLLGMVSMR